ncbi:MAG: pentapeptide repeat-containing protein, partial [Leptolyngbyaceae cyanobacterium MO_188.B28]|nr:pentapeptide repeat-containing protein [Leptolyngbyaceae cyanobacterium MO_188.B28]
MKIAWKHGAVLCWLLFAETILAANSNDIQKLKETRQCPNCDLRDADLADAYLQQANLRGADL